MSEASPDLHVGPAPDAPAEVPPSAPVEVASASVVSGNPVVSPSTMTNPAPAVPFIVGPSGATLATITQAAPDVDPLVVANARIAALEASEATLMQRVQEVSQQHSALQQALDAERANPGKPGTESYVAQVGQMRLEIARLEAEVARLQTSAPVATLEATAGLSDTDVARIKDAVLEALAEHATAQVADAPADAEASGPIARGIARGA